VGERFDSPVTGRRKAVEIRANLDLVSDAHNDARRKCVNRVHWARSAVRFAIDLAFVQNVGTADIEDGFLAVHGSCREGRDEQREKHQKSNSFE
jgi:hypothetical protein